MKTVFDHVDTLKSKPHHVRKQVAFTSAAGIAAFVGIVWLGGSLATGSFALKNSNFADTNAGGVQVVHTTDSGNAGLAGAAGALNQNTSAPAHIEIVDATTSSTISNKEQPTVIPF